MKPYLQGEQKSKPSQIDLLTRKIPWAAHEPLGGLNQHRGPQGEERANRDRSSVKKLWRTGK